MTARELLTFGYKALFLAEVDTPFLDAAVLLAFALGVTKEKLLASLPEQVDGSSEERFRTFLDRRSAGIPVAYIRKAKEFYGLEFYVDERVLVPRPDTELVVEKTLEICRSEPWVREVHDACTGSGCIGITLQHLVPELHVSVSDISVDAAEVFRINSGAILGRELVFSLADALDGVEGPFDLITANPPYLSDQEAEGLARIGWPEPAVSLRGGSDGTALAARIIQRAAERLRPGGWLVLEGAPDQLIKLHALMDRWGFRSIGVDKDLAGSDRVISGTLPPPGHGSVVQGDVNG